MFWWHLLDVFFLFFHTILMFFNLFGWIFMKTRKLNLMVLFITAFSWFGLGVFYGFGYCFLTDWHWDILEKLGYRYLPDTYLQLLLERAFQIQITTGRADIITAGGFLLALLISGILNTLDYRSKHKEKPKYRASVSS